MAAPAIVPGATQGRERTDDRERRRAEAGEGEPEVHGAVAVRGLVGHSAEHGLHGRFVAGQVDVGILAEAGDRDVDHRGIERVEHVVAEAEPIRDPGSPALDEDLGAIEDCQELLARRGIVEIDLDAPLAAVEDRNRFRCASSLWITAGWFHPHDIGAIVGEHPRRARPGRPTGAVDHPEPFDRPDHVRR